MSTFWPTQISGCQLWLDAAESGSVQTSGGFVTQWTDRSINARVFTPVSANTITTTTQNNLTSLNFGANRMTNASFAWRSVFTTIIVAKSSNGAFLFSQQSGASYNRYVFTGNQSLLRVTSGVLLLVDDSVIPDGTPVTASNEYFIFILGRPSGANFGSPYRINGTARTTDTDPDIPTDGTTTNPLWINGNSSGGSSTAEVAEILFYSDTLTTANCESLEGYLAWKWGLTANLPSDHPYKNYPPQFVQPNTQVIMTNTNTNPGTLILPSTFTLPGLTYTFKDQVGAFSTNSLTLTTNNANQTIDSIITSTINTQPLGWQTFIAGNNNRWYTVGGTVINTINTSTLNTTVLRSVNISSANLFVSSLGIIDQTLRSTTQLYVQSTFLYYSFSNQSTIISGTRQSFGGLFTPIRRLFQPNQLTGLNLWIDASDPNTFASTRGTIISNIFDKSGARSIINTFDNTSVVYEQGGLSGLPSFNLVNGHFRGTISTSRPMTRYTNTTFIVTQLITAPPANGYPCMALAEAAIGSGTFYRNLDYSTVGPSFRQVGFFAGVSVTSNAAQVGTPFIMNTNYSAALNGNTLFMRYNGSSAGVVTQSAATAPTTNATHFFVGTDGFTNTYISDPNTWTGRVSEILMYNVQLTQAQQEQVEGYLAWKWNLVSFLPAAHPYKNFPP